MERVAGPVAAKGWLQDDRAASLAAACAAGLTLATAGLLLPLGWFGRIVAIVALALGLAFGALAALRLSSRSPARPPVRAHAAAPAAARPR